MTHSNWEYTLLDAGTELPALVVGFEVSGEARSRPLAARLPRALLSFVQLHLHQFGGYCCLQTGVLGLTLRLEANPDKAGGRMPLDLLRGQLTAFSQEVSPVRARTPAAPELVWLRDFIPSSGEEFGADERQRMEAVLSAAMPGLPPIDTAWEAFVRFQESGAGRLLGWRVFTVHPASDEGPSVLEDWDPAALRCADDLELSPAHLRALEAFGQEEGLGPPRLFLLWDNSD
jgi:hypothetical protein